MMNCVKAKRIWVDGCFDMGHFGHANLLRQAKELGETVVVGIHSDEQITKYKGRAPIFTEDERYKIVAGFKWVDEVIKDVPYITTLETVKRNNCDLVVHGSDVSSTKSGENTYQTIIDAGLFQEVPRTQGISTTQLIKRVLKDENVLSPYTGKTLLLSTQRILEFRGNRRPTEKDTIVYVAGGFDLYHPGHVDFLREAKMYGSYLIVGIHDDSVYLDLQGPGYPYMKLHERALTVLGCKYVDEVLIGAPYQITEELMEYFKINLVCHNPVYSEIEPYKVPIDQGKYQSISSGNDLTTKDIIYRIELRRDELLWKTKEKEIQELEKALRTKAIIHN